MRRLFAKVFRLYTREKIFKVLDNIRDELKEKINAGAIDRHVSQQIDNVIGELKIKNSRGDL